MWTAVLITAVTLALTCAFHFEALRLVAHGVTRTPGKPGQHLTLTLSVVTLIHVIEALAYALVFWVSALHLKLGDLVTSGGRPAGRLMDFFYFSLVNYTTLGRGDLNPQGHLQFIAGIEAFQGFLVITISGAFLFQVMTGKAPMAREAQDRREDG